MLKSSLVALAVLSMLWIPAPTVDCPYAYV